MSTKHGTAGIRPATERQQYYSPLEAYWDAFREWRKFERLRTQLCRLTDDELMDIGITRGEIDYVATNRANDPRGADCAQ